MLKFLQDVVIHRIISVHEQIKKNMYKCRYDQLCKVMVYLTCSDSLLKL